MNFKSIKTWLLATLQIGVCTVAIALPLLVACGGKISPADTSSTSPGVSTAVVSGPNSFLLFSNPLDNTTLQTPINSQEFADTYYQTIDPNNERDTLEHWKTKNGFGNTATGVEKQAVFGDVRDLGYGRYLTGRWNNDDTWAFLVDNYSVAPTANYAYTNMNVEVAVAKDKQWFGGTNAIEVSPGPLCTTPLPNAKPECRFIVKFYNFSPVTGERQTQVNLDGRGMKAMPGVCLTCHGGRADEILPTSIAAASSVTIPPGTVIPRLFPQYGDPISAVRGDLKAKLHFFEVDTFDFSTKPGYTRADQEDTLKTLNKWVLCTFPMPSTSPKFTAPNGDEDDCRQYNTNLPFDPINNPLYRHAYVSEWGSPAAALIKAAYGGQGMPNATYSDTYVPSGWLTVGQSSLYENVVKPACRICHLLRGTDEMPDIMFDSFAGFQAYADKIKYHVIDRGNMPVSKILSNRFWSTPSMYQELDLFLAASNPVANDVRSFKVTDANGNQLKPGRPIANPGPDRPIATLSTQLSAEMSMFADTYSWSIVTNPSGLATLSSTTGSRVTFTAGSDATADGMYEVQLIASRNGVQSDPVILQIFVNTANWPTAVSGVKNTTYPKPADIRFADIKKVFSQCTGCHSPSNTSTSTDPPIYFTNIDRNGDGVVESGVGQTDDVLFYNQILSLVNFTDIDKSELVQHPSGHAHKGGFLTGFSSKGKSSKTKGIPSTVSLPAEYYPPGNPDRDAYDMFINWMLNGAPYQ
jgi:hypothetical protein